MRTIVWKDPHCSGLQHAQLKDKEKPEKFLASKGFDEDSLSGDTLYYVVVDGDESEQFCLDFT